MIWECDAAPRAVVQQTILPPMSLKRHERCNIVTPRFSHPHPSGLISGPNGHQQSTPPDCHNFATSRCKNRECNSSGQRPMPTREPRFTPIYSIGSHIPPTPPAVAVYVPVTTVTHPTSLVAHPLAPTGPAPPFCRPLPPLPSLCFTSPSSSCPAALRHRIIAMPALAAFLVLQFP